MSAVLCGFHRLIYFFRKLNGILVERFNNIYVLMLLFVNVFALLKEGILFSILIILFFFLPIIICLFIYKVSEVKSYTGSLECHHLNSL